MHNYICLTIIKRLERVVPYLKTIQLLYVLKSCGIDPDCDLFRDDENDQCNQLDDSVFNDESDTNNDKSNFA